MPTSRSCPRPSSSARRDSTRWVYKRHARGTIMNTLSRRHFLRTSGTVVGASVLAPLVSSGRAHAAEKELVPKKLPFPPNDEFGSYEPTITQDHNTIYFDPSAANGDKRVLGSTPDLSA